MLLIFYLHMLTLFSGDHAADGRDDLKSHHSFYLDLSFRAGQNGTCLSL